MRERRPIDGVFECVRAVAGAAAAKDQTDKCGYGEGDFEDDCATKIIGVVQGFWYL